MHRFLLLLLFLSTGCGAGDADPIDTPLRRCVQAGGTVYDDTEDRCCPGLTESWIAAPGEPQEFQEDYDLPEGCALDAAYLLGGSLCLPCGDGTCDDSETWCTCPEDCEPP